jgi:hypothetical protein
VWIKRVAHRIALWQRRPRFRAPKSGIVLAVLLVAALLVLLLRGSGVPGGSPHPSPPLRVTEPPVRTPEAAPPPAPVPAKPAERGCPEGCAEPPPGCDIKGNIARRTGERIYHLPGQRYYGSTVISPEHGEAWFCTEVRGEGQRLAEVEGVKSVDRRLAERAVPFRPPGWPAFALSERVSPWQGDL